MYKIFKKRETSCYLVECLRNIKKNYSCDLGVMFLKVLTHTHTHTLNPCLRFVPKGVCRDHGCQQSP